MKILGICGSPRKDNSRTAQLVKEVLDAAETTEVQTEYLDVTMFHINPCLACDRCHRLGYCTQRDDFKVIFDKVAAADGIVLGSPVYIYQVTAQLKVFIDRLGQALHCQWFLGKYGAVVVTANGLGHEETADYLERLLVRLGAQCVGKLANTLERGPLVPDSPLVQEARALGEMLRKMMVKREEISNQVVEQQSWRRYFRELMVKRKDVWSWEYRYWQQKGWL